MKTILLKFSGPMQSWGTNSHFETRHTNMYPSKSAVIGIIAACLGYKRHETQKIQELNSLDFAVRVDQVGDLLKDYHIVRSTKKNKELYKKDSIDRTYVTNRYYLSDYVFVVAISHKSSEFIHKIYEALKRPYFQPYLGRKSIPLNNDFLIGLTDTDIRTAIETLDCQASDEYKKHNYMCEDDHTLDVIYYSNTVGSKQIKDKVISFDVSHRQYGFNYYEISKTVSKSK